MTTDSKQLSKTVAPLEVVLFAALVLLSPLWIPAIAALWVFVQVAGWILNKNLTPY